ncbi:U4/U6.U5 tri-snRNP-associated protein 1 [Cryptosporidium felis]|nr:U4/U6.U5 tri-snRNP-associated protein 1 [Cryptosporidium felis]
MSDKILHSQIFTFKDSHVLESDDEENNKFSTKVQNEKLETRIENYLNTELPKNEPEKTDKVTFKRTAIKVIKRNLRDEYKTDGKYIKNNDNTRNNNMSTNSELTNFNANFITNSDCIFDDNDIFYNKLKIQRKKKKNQHLEDEFENPSSKIITRVPPENDNQNSASNICLSLETEFCKIIDNETESADPQCHLSNNPLNNQSNTGYSTASNTKSSDNEIKAETISENSNKKENIVITGDKILHEEPLDFGISSTIAYLKSRNGSSFSKPDKTLTNHNYTQSNSKNLEQSSNQVSIFHTDNNGNVLNPKEAFKRLCWKFHGQKVNKNKLEKMFRSHLRNATS